MGYYDPLRDYLLRCEGDEVVLTFAQIEGILGRRLPASAGKYDAWWANVGDDASTQHSHARSWHAAGYKARAHRTEGKVVFYRVARPVETLITDPTPAAPRGEGRNIALVACAKQKQSMPCRAAELYAPSTLFSLSYIYAKGNADRVYILSAKYGLVDEDEVIAPYDETLNDMSVDDRKAWSTRVLARLAQVCDVQADHFIILAGRNYYEYLLPGLVQVTLPLGNLPLGKRVELLRRLNASFDEAPSGAEGAALWLHRLFERLPRYDWQGIDDIPFDDGISILYERGETYYGFARVVHVGAHTAPGRLKQRLADHFLREDRNASILRKNIGKALLNRSQDPYLDIWSLDTSRYPNQERENPRSQAQVEREVSSYMRINLAFSVIPIASAEERLRLKAAIIATLHQAKDFEPSNVWLGRHSPEPAIRKSGLWLKQGMDAAPLTANESLQLARIIVPG